jgi:ATP-dependent protease ClpP protease subunit
MAMNEIKLYGVIGEDVTAQSVKTLLAKMDQSQPLFVRIDSEGGSVFDGLSIYEAFAAYPGPKKAVIEPTAFSIASYIAAAFDDVEIVGNGYMMIHSPWTEAAGTASDLHKQAELLDKLQASMVQAYSQRTGKSEDEIKALLEKETWLNAQEAVQMGLATRVVSTEAKTRLAPHARHQTMPQMVFAALFGAGQSGEKSVPTQESEPMSNPQTAATLQEIKAAFPKAKAEFVLNCLEKSLPLASVAAAAAEELLAENDDLKAKLSAMEEEMAALKAKAEEVVEEEVVEEVEEEPAAKPQAKAKGVKPIARASSASKSGDPRSEWKAAVDGFLAQCNGDRARASMLANRHNPGLRDRMLAMSN